MPIEPLENIVPNSCDENMCPESISADAREDRDNVIHYGQFDDTSVSSVTVQATAVPLSRRDSPKKELDDRAVRSPVAWLVSPMSYGREISELKHALVPMFNRILHEDEELFFRFEEGFRELFSEVFLTDSGSSDSVKELCSALLFLSDEWESLEKAKKVHDLLDRLSEGIDPKMTFGVVNSVLSAVHS